MNITNCNSETATELASLSTHPDQWLSLFIWLKGKCFASWKDQMYQGIIDTPAGKIPRVNTRLTLADRLGAARVRWLINRDHYRIEPGLYAIGNPDRASDVMVTANYKLSFDHLRKNLSGINAWILVLDTKGINVWCAAGKGTFGTRELVRRIRETKLESIISHRRLIVPQLGATGISAHRVSELTAELSSEDPPGSPSGPIGIARELRPVRNFKVVFGPVRAADIKSFINLGYRATPSMRRVTFGLSDRLKLIPVDLVYNRYKFLAALLILILIAAVGQGFRFPDLGAGSLRIAGNLLAAYLSGIVITPLLLPWLPGRMFAIKGLVAGVLISLFLLYLGTIGLHADERVAWFLIIPSVSSFLAMNFTGASTYTSLSGVKKEMRIAVPAQVTLAGSGLLLFIIHQIS